MDTNFTKFRKMATRGDELDIVVLCGYTQTKLNRDMINGLKFTRYEKFDCNLLAGDLGMKLFYFNKNFITRNDYYSQYIKLKLKESKIKTQFLCKGKALDGYFINSVVIGFYKNRYIYPFTAAKLDKPLLLNKNINCNIELNEHIMPMKLNISLTNN